MRLLPLIFLSTCLILVGCSHPNAFPEVRKVDKPIVSKAIKSYTKGKVTESEFLRNVGPSVVYLPNMTCVGLNLKENTFGGDTTICYDKNGRQVLYYVSGQ